MPPAVLPRGWAVTRLGAFCSEVSIRAGVRSYPVLSVTKHRGVIPADTYFSKAVHGRDTTKYKVLRRGQFAYATIHLNEGSIGRLAAVEEGIVSPMYTVFEADDAIVDPEYLACALKTPQALTQYSALVRGSVNRRGSIPFQSFADLHLAHPPKSEQRKVVAALAAADHAAAADEAVVEHLDRLRRDLMENLLRSGLPAHRHRLRHSAIGMIPEAWSVRTLSEVGEVQTGLAKGKVPAGAAVELPYLRVANVQDGYVDLTEMKTVLVEKAAVDRYRLRQGDVLFTEGGDFDKLGRGCVWRGAVEPCLHQNHVFAVRPGPELLPEFLASHAASQRGRSYFLDCAKRTTNLASINSTQLKAFPIPVPPLAEQRGIVAAAVAVADRIAKERAVVAERRRLKVALAEALLTGTIRVSDVS